MKINRGIVLFTIILTSGSACRKSGSGSIRIEQGLFRVTITETGELQAVNSKIITMLSCSTPQPQTMLFSLHEEPPSLCSVQRGCRAGDTRCTQCSVWTPLHADFESVDLNKRPLNSPPVNSKPVRVAPGVPYTIF